MENTTEITTFDALVGRFFFIEDRTIGHGAKDFLARYRGRLTVEDSEAAYDQLAASLRPLGITPLFREEDGRQAVILVPGRPDPKPSNPWVNLILFLLTVVSVMFAGGISTITEIPESWVEALPAILLSGWPFAASLLAILGAHELGHYFAGRLHGVQLTLPYFIPLPFMLFGTMGAVINMKEQPRNRRHLLDIGLAGPLAGLVVGIPVLVFGLSLSQVQTIPAAVPQGMALQLEGNSILYIALKYLMFGQMLPTPASFGGLPEWQYWLRYFFTGQPYPLGGLDVTLHPVALAGWGGILVTSLNLIPAGQLDGGHVLYVLFGRKNAARLLPVVIGVIALLGIFWPGWWLWVALILVFGRAYAEPLDQITPLNGGRRAMALLALVIFLLVFIPVPLNIITAPAQAGLF